MFQRHRQAHREHLLDIVAWVEQGQLAVDWFYSVNRHHSATIERLAADFADRLRAIIRHCESTDDVLYTPSDFAEFAWDDGDLEQITAEISKSIEIQKT